MQIINNNYFSKYINTYFWQFLAFLVRFISMFIVMPYLTKDPSTYGIYAACVSVTIFFGYADFGFMRSGQKFASENIGIENRNEEMRFIGFTTFILVVFTILIALILFILSFKPVILLKGVNTISQIEIASKLLLILAIFTPVSIFHRMISMIFEIRLDGYIYQRVSLIASLATISSVLFFFKNNDYKIVQYFLFSQFVNLFSIFVCYKISQQKYNYNYLELFKKIRFDKQIYRKCSKLAFSGIYVMIAAIIFYEIDNVIISKYIGIREVAIYSISISFSNLFRLFFGTLFAPFYVRMNYFIANNEIEELKVFCIKIITNTAPLIILPITTFILISKSFILSWVGSKYLDSAAISNFIALTFVISFFSYTASMLLTAMEEVKEMYIITTVQPIMFWFCIFLFYPTYGLITFGFFKFMAVFIAEIFYFNILRNKINLNFSLIINKILKPIILPLMSLIFILIFFKNEFPFSKSKLNLAYISLLGLCALSFSFFVLYFTSFDFKVSLNRIFKK
jgi:O-antigen/teichoic acid export membrane protein